MTDLPRAPSDTKDRLLDAAQRLFARDGVQGATIREINELADQRNPSAMHYHFGSRTALVEAILVRFQRSIDTEFEHRLAALEATGVEPGIRERVDAVVRPLVATLETQAGRDCVRIIPQMLPALSRNLRRGVAFPSTPAMERILGDLDRQMAERRVPEPLRRERLVAYALVFTTLLGERAHLLCESEPPLLDTAAFTHHLVDTLTAILTAPAD